ncbi:MAG: DUF1501 domain-containing protein, partial [Saprospiraceae bacterium]|nr:DUF1501 domain-containing protein [Saprospiraceae bacterium]
ARPDVILPESSLLNLDGVQDAKLHPSLGGFQSLYDEGELAIVQNVGYPEQNFSHFRSTDIWMTGADTNELLATGWLGRYLNNQYPNYPAAYPNEDVPDPLAIELGYNLSVAFQGPVSGMGMVVGDPEWFYRLVNNIDAPVPDTQAGDKLRYVRLVTKQSQVYGEVIKNAASKITQQGGYPDTELGEQLKIVARLIAGGLQTRLYMVSLHGFDTHDSQVLNSDHTKGEHANLLATLGDAVRAFRSDLKGLQIEDRVVGATVSEFGRRIISNASLGTDHGAAAPMFIFGKHVEGGILGKNPVIPETPDVEDNLGWEYDFRSVYASLLSGWFCTDSSTLQETINKPHEILPIINPSVCGTTSSYENLYAAESWVRNYPNPVTDVTTIEFKGTGKPIRIDVINAQGQIVETIIRAKVGAGTHQITWDASRLTSGMYYLNYHNGAIHQSNALMKH